MKLVELTEVRDAIARPTCAVNAEEVLTVTNAGADYTTPTATLVRFRTGEHLLVAESVMEVVTRLRGR